MSVAAAKEKCWRLIPFSTDDAATNMAYDEAILESHIAGHCPATLRLYGFKPEAVSIGQNQQMPAHVISRIRECGLELVRRPTGGRAVLHAGDLTYSFVGSYEHGALSSSVTIAYRQICRGLQNGLQLAGVNLELGNEPADSRHRHDCFLATTGSDLHVNGNKMIGSAQLRRRQAVLQHGSILLDQDQGLFPEILGEYNAPDSSPVNSPANLPAVRRHANLFETAGRTFTWQELEEMLKIGFESAFAVKLKVSTLTAYELELAGVLRAQYKDDM